MKHFIIYSVFLLTAYITDAQNWKVAVGADLTIKPQILRSQIITPIAENLAIAQHPYGPYAPSNRVIQLYLERTLLTKNRSQLSVALAYRKRSFNHIATYQHKPNWFIIEPYTPNDNFFFQLKGGYAPFKRLLLSAGLGVGLHAHRKVDNNTAEDFVSFEDPDRYHPLFKETYQAVHRIHRPVTFNYHLSVGYAFLKRWELIVYHDGSIGHVHRTLRINGSDYNLPMKWRSVGAMLAYRFSVDEVFNFFRPDKNDSI